MRLFVGIPIPAAVKRELTALSAPLRSTDEKLRWSSPESWHITLQFLGNTDHDRYACLVTRLRTVRCAPVLISFEGLSSFGGAGVLIGAVKPLPGLLELQHRVTLATEQCGFIPDTGDYRPHVTLARGKGRRGSILLREIAMDTTGAAAISDFEGAEFLLYESILGPSCSRYEVRERFPLSLAGPGDDICFRSK